jgi:hypothetical protein
LVTFSFFKNLVGRTLAAAGYELRALGHPIVNVDEGFAAAAAGLSPYTMTSQERLHALWQAVLHVERAGIEGDVVECGVWRGGSAMLACRALLHAGSTRRTVHLFDTFEGMSAPGEEDVDQLGRAAGTLLASAPPSRAADSIWCLAPLDDVRRNLLSTGYPEAKLRFIAGKVEETLPAAAPERIALLRLDTDWYASTRHELIHLLPRVADGGVLIVDDYGHWRGARKAVDEVLSAMKPPLLLHRIDATGRIGLLRRS